MNIKKRQAGFTIIELMIATTIFSIILVVATSGVIAIGRMYYKGITSSKTQETTRFIMEEISRNRQFSGGATSQTPDPAALPAMGDPAGFNQAVCFGKDRYVYRINDKVESPSSIGLRYDDTRNALSSCDPAYTGGKQMLGANMRLLDFVIISAGEGKTKIKVKVAYGDNDLLDIYDNDSVTRTAIPYKDAQCRSGIAGSNFCATAELASVVNKRIK